MMESHKNLVFKSVIQFDPLYLESNKSNKDFISAEKDKNKLLQSKKANPLDDEIKRIEKNLHLTKRNYSEYNNKKLLSQIAEDIISIENILEEDNENSKDEGKITFLNIICFILKKINKKLVEIELLKTYFLSFPKLVNLFLPLNININDMMTRLASQIKYEKKGKNKILFKEGDKGDKFYIILKGEVGILIPQEKKINCCPTEYLKYLIFLHLYQEKSLINKLLMVNREILKMDERIFYALMDGLKFYHFFILYSGTKKSYNSPIEFLHLEIKINDYIRKKYDFSPEQAFHTLNLTNISEDIYEYYSSLMKNMQSTFLTNLKENQKKPIISSLASATNLTEFGEYIKDNEPNKKKLQEFQFFDKLFHINELSTKFTMSTTTDEYIRRTNCEKRMKFITSDAKNNIIKYNERVIEIKYFNYLEVNQLKDKNIFGELALINPNQKRTATIILKENCHFGILDKESYDISIKTAQEKERMRNLLFFTNGFLFNGLTNNYFLNNYFFRFKKKTYNSGNFLFKRGEKRTKIFFIISGELQLGGKMTLKKLTEVMRFLEGDSGWDDGGVSKKYYKESVDFKKYFHETQNYFRFYVLKKKEIAGLDDMTENGIFLFDCKVNSSEPAEIYEFDYEIYENCLKEKTVQMNNNDYVSTKKKLLIDRLYKQRDSIAKNEFKRIKIYILNNKNLQKEEKNDDNDIKNIKKEKSEKNYFTLNNTFCKKKINTFIEENKINISNFNNDTKYINRKLPYLYSTGNFNNENRKIRNNIIMRKTENNDFVQLDPPNLEGKRKSIESNYSINNNKQILIKLEKNKRKREKAILNLLKSENLNLNKISAYLNNNDFTFFKSKRNSTMNIDQKQISSFNKSLNKKQRESTQESYNVIPNKNKFTFNNQKLFSFLLNNTQFQSNKNDMNSNPKNKQITINDYENKKESLINNNYKIVNTDIIDSKKKKRNKIKIYPSKNDSNSFKRKNIQSIHKEDYNDIFVIDCLCLDKWEEKNNKFKRKKTNSLKGKKLTLQ